MKNIFYILLLLPTIIFAQYPSNSGQKITLGEQTTADGLVYRGVLNDTSLITPSSDTSAYIILDTVNNRFYNYNRSTNVWSLTGGGVSVSSFSAGTTGLTPSTATTGAVTLGGTLSVANGGTNTSTLTENKVMVGNGTSGVLTPTNLHWDNTNSRLGINKNNPSWTLQVVSDLVVPAFFSSSADATIMAINNSNSGNGNPQFKFFLDDIGKFAVGVDDSDSDKFKIGTTDLGTNTRLTIDASGNVGIGTTTPTAVLHLKAGTATASTAPLKFTSGVSLEAPEVGAMEFSNISGTNKLYISPANNVRKEIAYTDFTNASGVLPVANGGTGQTTLAAAGINTGSGTLNYLPKYTATGTTLGNSIIFNNGSNVGIGTASPNAKLEVNSGTILNYKPAVNSNAIFAAANNTFSWQFGINDGADFVITGGGFAGLGTEKVRITSGGNVGIGTTSPNYLLDLQTTSTYVTNNLKVNASAAENNYAEIAFQLWSGAGSGENVFGGSGTSRPSAVIRALSEDNSVKGALLFATFTGGATNANLTEKMRITSGGNVGIGTTSPAVQFHTTGAVRFATFAGGGTTTLDVDNTGNLARTSSIELKKDVTPINYGLNQILQINPINFNWINEDKYGNENENGFIAEDVMNVIPNVVGSDAHGLFMDYTKLIPILTKAIQEQQALIKALEQRLLILENK